MRYFKDFMEKIRKVAGSLLLETNLSHYFILNEGEKEKREKELNIELFTELRSKYSHRHEKLHKILLKLN